MFNSASPLVLHIGCCCCCFCAKLAALLAEVPAYSKYRLNHDTEVGMGFTHPRAECPSIV